MLELLMQQKGRPISTEQFMESIWGYDSDAENPVLHLAFRSQEKHRSGDPFGPKGLQDLDSVQL